MSNARRSKQPIDRLTRLCDAMTDTLAAHPEHGDDVRGVIMLSDRERGGLVAFGYDGNGDVTADVLVHLKSLFEAHGQTLVIMPLGRDA